MQSLFDIALVMLISGTLGGLVNCFVADTETEKPLPWWQHIFVGIAAAFMVPLFLNMISGDLIDKIRGTPPGTGDYSKLFVLSGFCLVAAVSSRAFIRSLSDRVLQQVRSANTKAEEAKTQAAEAKAAVAPLVEEDSDDDLSAVIKEKLEIPLKKLELTGDEEAVLTTMTSSSYSLRSITGIANDSGLSKSNVNTILSTLMGKGLVTQGQSSKGQPRWYPTQAGHQAITNASQKHAQLEMSSEISRSKI